MPLWWLHVLGYLLGKSAWYLVKRKRERVIALMRSLGIDNPEAQFRRYLVVISRVVLDYPWWWLNRDSVVSRHVSVESGQEILDGLGRNPPLFVGGHLSSPEPLVRCIGRHAPLCYIYQNSKSRIASFILSLRHQPPRFTALPSSDPGSIRFLLDTLKNNGAALMYTDMRPPRGSGDWLDFFGRKSYTMTLAARLSLRPRVRVIFFECYQGFNRYRVRLTDITEQLPADLLPRAQAINDHIERVARTSPDQYLWFTNRFRAP